MIREALDEKYSYQIDEHGMVHLFRGEEDYRQYLTNPLLSAIFKIEALKKENAELKEQCSILADCNTCHSSCKNENAEMKEQLTEAKEIMREMLGILPKENIEGVYEITEGAEQFLRELEE